VALSVAVCLALAPSAGAAEITVDTTHDELNGDGDCSLREAVQAANTNAAVSGCESGEPGEDTIALLRDTTHVLNGPDGENANQVGDLDITESLRFNGHEARIDCLLNDRALDIHDGGPAPVAVAIVGSGFTTAIRRCDSGPADGGAIRAREADSSLALEGVQLIYNSSGDDGGAIYAEGSVDIDLGGLLEIRGNEAEGNGGAIESFGPLSIHGDPGVPFPGQGDGRMTGNVAGGFGGAIDSQDSATLDNMTFGGNRAEEGGALAHRSEQPLTIDNSTFQRNRARGERDDPAFLASGFGGAVSIVSSEDGTASVAQSSFSGNSGLRGGAISTTGSQTTLSVTHSAFTDNVSRQFGSFQGAGGGAIQIGEASLSLSGSRFRSNTAYDGGAINSFGGDISATSTAFVRNEAHHIGGAFRTFGGQVVIQGGRFAYNEAGAGVGGDSGGAIATSDSHLIVDRVTFRRNVAHGLDGGAIASGGGQLEISEALFANNRSGDFGGALDIFGGASLELTNSTLTGNVSTGQTPASGGGAIYLEGDAGPALLVHDTIALNRSRRPGSGGGIHVVAPAEATLERSILAFNAAATSRANCGGGGVITSAGYNLESHDTCGLTATGDLVGTNPLLAPLADNGGPTGTMGLYGGSPALDAIRGADCPPPATDQRGEPRPAGPRCDIGAFEGTVPGPAARCAGHLVTIQGTATDDVLIGTPTRDIISGLGDDDVIKGARGNDIICGGSGNDRLRGGMGDDGLHGDRGEDQLFGGPGRDRLFGGPGRDRVTQ
jgi:CSLREA domain-containing protein